MDAFPTIIGVCHTGIAADHAAALVAAVVAFVANVHHLFRIDKGIADAAEAVTCLIELCATRETTSDRAIRTDKTRA